MRDEEDLRAAHRRLAELAADEAEVLVERMAPPGAELLVAARLEGVVPNLVIAAGGLWTEVLGDAAVVPLPADAGPGRGGDPLAAGRAAVHGRPGPPRARRRRPPPGWPRRSASCCSGPTSRWSS